MHYYSEIVIFGYIIVLLLNYVESNNIPLHTPIVDTIYGQVQGRREVSRNGRYYQSFTSIPFAKPPIGELRFAPPQEPDPWNVPLLATNVTPICIQRDYLVTYTPPIQGSEDCLYINVYVPEVNNCDNRIVKNKLLPVFVYIHWGGFFAGSSGKIYFSPDYLMDKDIVLVTFNYRLGPFGFLTTLDDEAPGNFGLKDQVAALKWIQQNIEYFGGDRKLVTIGGQSAGGASVHYHLLSQESKGLFHQAISQSGNSLAPWAFINQTYQKQITTLQAYYVNCGNYSSNSKKLIECLRNVSAEEILNSMDNFKTFFADPLVTFGATVEKKTLRNPKPFLVQSPADYLKKGMFQKIPWMTGVVKDEGILKVSSLLRNENIRNALNENFKDILSNSLFGLSFSTTDIEGLYRNISNFYFGGKDYINFNNPSSVQGFIDSYSDRLFVYPLYQSLIKQLSYGHKPIYLYSFEYEGKDTYGDVFSFTTDVINFKWGTCHCDDLLYLFHAPRYFDKLEDETDINLSKHMVDIWTNFVINGDPNIVTNGRLQAKFKPLDTQIIQQTFDEKVKVFNITGSNNKGFVFKNTVGFLKERIHFWLNNNIYENTIF